MLKCINCTKKIINRKPSQTNRSKNHFCCRGCSASYNNTKYPKRKTKKICSIKECQNIVERWQYKRCKIHALSIVDEPRIRDLTLSELRKRETKYARVGQYIRDLNRSWNKHKKGKPCIICKYSIFTELCHIKPIKSFNDNSTISEINDPNNIAVLCPNHHKELDMDLFCIILV